MMPFVDKNEWLTFSEFVLCESLIPTETSYGLNENFDDKEWYHISSKRNYYITFVKIAGQLYCVGLWDNGVTFFARAKDDSIKLPDIITIDYLEEVLSDDRKETRNILKVFSNLIFVIIEGMHRFSINVIRFDAANEALSKVYDRIPKNKHLIDFLNNIGIFYNGVINGYHFYSKKGITK